MLKQSQAGLGFQLRATYTHRPYIFCAGSEEVRDRWLQILTQAQEEAEAMDKAIGISVEQIWTSYESARGNATLNTHALDVVVEQGVLQTRGDYFVACYCKGDQKFRTWICSQSEAPIWGCDGTFAGEQDKMRVKMFARNALTGVSDRKREFLWNSCSQLAFVCVCVCAGTSCCW
jgi:hypothetical protein